MKGGMTLRMVGGKTFLRPIEKPGKAERRAKNKAAAKARRKNR